MSSNVFFLVVFAGKNCRLRWFYQLDRKINRRGFSEEVDSDYEQDILYRLKCFRYLGCKAECHY